MYKSRGFNLIEIIIIVVILGFLAVIAIPKLIDLYSRSSINTTKSLASAISNATLTNYSIRTKHPRRGIPIRNCSDVAKLLPKPLPKGYSVLPTEIAANTRVICILNGPGSTAAMFNANGIT